MAARAAPRSPAATVRAARVFVSGHQCTMLHYLELIVFLIVGRGCVLVLGCYSRRNRFIGARHPLVRVKPGVRAF